jgi:hypothetical protein
VPGDGDSLLKGGVGFDGGGGVGFGVGFGVGVGFGLLGFSLIII